MYRRGEMFSEIFLEFIGITQLTNGPCLYYMISVDRYYVRLIRRSW